MGFMNQVLKQGLPIWSTFTSKILGNWDMKPHKNETFGFQRVGHFFGTLFIYEKCVKIGGFLKWEYPISSFISIGFSTINQPAIGAITVPHDYGTPHISLLRWNPPTWQKPDVAFVGPMGVPSLSVGNPPRVSKDWLVGLFPNSDSLGL